MPEETTRKPDDCRVGPCQPAFESQEECDRFFREFAEAVGPDMKELARIRAEGARRLFLGQL